MSTQAKFFFTGNSDQFTKALSQVKKSMKQVATQTVVLQAGLKLLSATVNTVARTLTTVLGAAIKGIVNIVKSALNAIKALITGAFKFIKTALTTLLSWITKALGKVFDWIGSMFNAMTKVASKTVNLAKKTVKQIADSVKAYADKEYNQIQLKVSLGDSYDSVMKDFKNLVKYTTADRNDLLSVYATFAELGKKPEEVTKYARAAVYLSNATGRSLSQITRLLLGQEAAGRDLEKVLGRIGISLSGQEESVSNVEKIINQLDDEMNALATGSLNQVFANIKNDIIAIRENIGQIFSGPVRYVAQKIDELLSRLAGSNKIEGLADKLNSWFKGIEPYIDKIFDIVERILQDPAGFLKALWSDIQTIFNNIRKNIWNYLSVLGYIIGKGINKLGEVIGNIEWTNVTKAFDNLATGLNGFVLALGQGAGWWSKEEIDKAGGSIKQMFINSWNEAHPDFTLDSGDKWYENLFDIIGGLWDDLSKSEKISKFWESFKDTFVNKVLPTLTESFAYLGQVLGVAINNAIASSDTIRKVLNIIPGVNFGNSTELAEKQQSLYGKVKNYIPSDWTASDLTYDRLMSSYSKNQTWLYHLLSVAEDAREELTWIRKTDVLEVKDYPSFQGFLSNLNNIWNPVDDASEAVEEAAKSVIEVTDAMQKELENRRNQIESSRFNFNLAGPKPGASILDIPGIPHYGPGGPVPGPTLAVLGEEGPEFVLSNDMLTGHKRTTGGGGVNVIDGAFLSQSGKWVADTAVNRILESLGLIEELNIIDEDLKLIDKNTSEIYKFVTKPQPVPRTTGGGGVNNNIPWGYLDENGTWRIDYFKKWIDTSKVGKILLTMGKMLLRFSNWLPTTVDNLVDYFKSYGESWYKAVDNITDILEFIPRLGLSLLGTGAKVGAFGSHIGNIVGNSFDEEGTFSILKMFGAIIQEFLPYLQKGLEVVGTLFDEAFEILGTAVQILGERIGKMLLPILEAFIPFMKTLADIVVALAPVVESVLAPAIRIVAVVLQILTGVLDKLMPVFAGLGATIQWISDSISWAIAGVINWLASWIPWVSSVEQKRPQSWGDYYNGIMGTYEAGKANSVGTSITSSTGTAGATASYNGATTVYMTNDFSGAYVVGNNGFRELALIIKNTLEDVSYVGQSV